MAKDDLFAEQVAVIGDACELMSPARLRHYGYALVGCVGQDGRTVCWIVEVEVLRVCWLSLHWVIVDSTGQLVLTDRGQLVVAALAEPAVELAPVVTAAESRAEPDGSTTWPSCTSCGAALVGYMGAATLCKRCHDYQRPERPMTPTERAVWGSVFAGRGDPALSAREATMAVLRLRGCGTAVRSDYGADSDEYRMWCEAVGG